MPQNALGAAVKRAGEAGGMLSSPLREKAPDGVSTSSFLKPLSLVEP